MPSPIDLGPPIGESLFATGMVTDMGVTADPTVNASGMGASIFVNGVQYYCPAAYAVQFLTVAAFARSASLPVKIWYGGGSQYFLASISAGSNPF